MTGLRSILRAAEIRRRDARFDEAYDDIFIDTLELMADGYLEMNEDGTVREWTYPQWENKGTLFHFVQMVKEEREKMREKMRA